MHCPYCKATVPEGSMLCPNCGENINSEEAATIANTTRKKEMIYAILGWVCFGISFVFIPILFGAGAFVFGLLTYRLLHKTHGVILMIAAVVGCIVGMIFGAILS